MARRLCAALALRTEAAVKHGHARMVVQRDCAAGRQDKDADGDILVCVDVVVADGSARRKPGGGDAQVLGGELVHGDSRAVEVTSRCQVKHALEQ